LKKYKIKEIFRTIQGEGAYAGVPVVFIRFSGCNKWSGREADKTLSICHFCDTDFYGGTSMTHKQILEEVDRVSGEVRIIVLSGGEPLLQLDEDLCVVLNQRYFLHVETNGSRRLNGLSKYIDHISMSPKQSMTETKLERCDDIKILYPFIDPYIKDSNFRTFPHTKMFIQPLEDQFHQRNIEDACNYVMKKGNLSLSLQLHKVLDLR